MTKKYKPNMFPIDSLKENVFFYFWYAAGANTVLSITAKPAHRTSVGDNEHSNAETIVQLLHTQYVEVSPM